MPENISTVPQSTKKQQFLSKKPEHYIVTAIKLPSGAVELITNCVNLESKMQYYASQYDDELRLHANPEVQIINWMVV